MAKMQQFDLEVSNRVDRDSDPEVGEAFKINIPPFVREDEDGEEYEAVEGRSVVLNPPNLSRFMSLQVSYELSDSLWEISSGATALIHSCLSPEDRAYVRRRFNNPEDPFDLGSMAEIIKVMMETWSARPTKKASGSSSSAGKRGSGSTPKRRSEDETSSEN